MKFPRTDGQSWFNLFRLDGRLPGDVVAVVALVAVADLAAFLPVVSDTVFRTLLGLPLVFFLPGYALVGVLFPHGPAVEAGRGSGDAARRIDWTERFALSLGGSLAVLPFVALALAGLGVGLSTPAVVLALSGLVVVAMAIGAVRRWRLPPEDRLRAPLGRLVEGTRARLAPTRRGRLLQVAVALSVVLATSSIAFAVAGPDRPDGYTGAMLLTENEEGELVASGYPTELTAGEPASLVLALENHEAEAMKYGVVVAVERVEMDDGEATVLEREVLSRHGVSTDANETVHVRHEVAPTMTGDDLRLSYYVYEGDAPETPDADSAYRHLFLSVNVTASG